MKQASLITATNLCINAPNGKPLLRGLSFHLNRGEMLVIQGENGLGKSTLLKVLIGLSSQASGDIIRNECSVSYLSQLHNQVFHIPLSLMDIIELGGAAHKNITERDALEIGLLEKSELQLAWNAASGGERQKALLTQVLLREATLLCLDEPMNHLDVTAKNKVMKILQDRSKQQGVLMVCHEDKAIPLVGNFGMILDLGRYKASC